MISKVIANLAKSRPTTNSKFCPTYDIRLGNTWEGSEKRCPDANPQNGYRRLVQGDESIDPPE